MNKDGSFDEHKVMYGFDTEQEARDAYLSNYEEGWTGLGDITGVSREEFKKWVDSSHRKTKPFTDYGNVKKSSDETVDKLIQQARVRAEEMPEEMEPFEEEEDVRKNDTQRGVRNQIPQRNATANKGNAQERIIGNTNPAK